VTEPTPDEVEFDCWSWGGPLHVRLRKDVFQPNYYGAVIGTIGVPAPAPASGFDVRALDAPPTPVVLAADSTLVRADRVIPAATCGVARGADGSYRERVPEKVVIHVLDGGTYDDDIAHWHTGSSCTPPHYVIKSDGEVTQMVAEKYMAQHAGPGGNPTMIGIEHDGTDADSANFTETMYVASAALVRDICSRNAIPVDRAHIIGHDEVPLQVLNQEHGDPGGYFDWDYYLALVRWDGVDPATKPLREVVDTAGPAAVTASAAWHEADRDSGRADWRQSRLNTGPSFQSAYGMRYMWADGAPDADPSDFIEFMFVAPAAGAWGVSAWWPILADGNPTTTIEIETTSSNPDQRLLTLVVDQRALSPMRGRKTVALGFSPTWYVLPAFDLTENDVVKVRVLRRSGAAGKVIADAFRFLKT
jgi:N-acetylmuramoyl-L-alanine amidase-like protein